MTRIILSLLLYSCLFSCSPQMTKSSHTPSVIPKKNKKVGKSNSQKIIVKENIAESEPVSIPDSFYRYRGALLTAGDKLQIELDGETRETIVTSGGFVHYLYVDKIHVAGKSVEWLTQELTRKLSEYFVDPIVLVTIKKWAERKVYVYGAREGSKAISLAPDQPLTLMQALIETGLTQQQLEYGELKLIRTTDGIRHSLPISARILFDKKETSRDIILRPKDLIIIKEAPEVHIHGEIKKPGSFPIKKYQRMLLWHLLSLAHGSTEKADLDNIAVIRRKQPGEYQISTISASLEKQKAFFLEPEDIVIIPTRESQYITVYGQVRDPGRKEMFGTIRLSMAIVMAGGPNAYASNTIYLVRYLQDGKVENYTFDYGAIIQGDSRQDIEMQAGDIVYIGSSLW